MKPIERAIKYVGSRKALAESLGVTTGAVGHWCAGARVPDPVQCWRIQDLTKGTVTKESLRPDVFLHPDDGKTIDTE